MPSEKATQKEIQINDLVSISTSKKNVIYVHCPK
jgi:hypothetical protein